MSAQLQPIRRIVTADDARAAPTLCRMAPRHPCVRWRNGLDIGSPTYGARRRVHRRSASRTPSRGIMDCRRLKRHVAAYRQLSARGGDAPERKRQQSATFGKLFQAPIIAPTACIPVCITDTIDYAIVLEGEIVAILDRGETTCGQGTLWSSVAPPTLGPTAPASRPVSLLCWSRQATARSLNSLQARLLRFDAGVLDDLRPAHDVLRNQVGERRRGPPTGRSPWAAKDC